MKQFIKVVDTGMFALSIRLLLAIRMKDGQ
jgi:hypothetical protein